MASMTVGSKPEMFSLNGNSWFCSTGIAVMSSSKLERCHSISTSKVLEDLISEHSNTDEKKCVLKLDDIPGGGKTFLYVAKFCYRVKIELSALNVVSLTCAAEHLGMTENYGEGNLISQTENDLNEICASWRDSLKALESCQEVLPYAEEFHIVSRCINSLAMKACADPSLFSWPMQINISAKPQLAGSDWWYDGASFLRLPFYKRLIMAIHSNGMKPERLAGALMHYVGRHLPLLGRQSGPESVKYTEMGPGVSDFADTYHRNLLEEVVELLPHQKGVFPSNFLLRLLRTAMVMEVSLSCVENLEKRVGLQLDQVAVEDILIPNTGYSVENLYNIDCVLRIIDYFLLQYHDSNGSYQVVNEGEITESLNSLRLMTMVGKLIDSYLAEVAPDVNSKMAKFQSLAAALPDYASAIDDGIYRAIDIYLKAHPWLRDSEREQLCGLMNCQKLSMEASMHAAQNERLALRVIVQILFFEQLRLRTSVAGWFFAADNLENSQNFNGNLALARTDVETQARESIVQVDEMKDRVLELEKECLKMKEEIDKLMKTKGGTWNGLLKRFQFNKASKTRISLPEESPVSTAPLIDRRESYSDETRC